MQRSSRWLVVGFIVLSSVGCDQATKSMAEQFLRHYSPISLLGDFIRFHYVENAGAMLGLGSSLPPGLRTWVLTIFPAAMLILLSLMVLLNRHLDRWQVLSFSLIIGGGCGNLLDRLFNDGVVIDFLNIGVGYFRSGIFNLADVAITTGAIMLLVSRSFKRWSGNVSPGEGGRAATGLPADPHATSEGEGADAGK